MFRNYTDIARTAVLKEPTPNHHQDEVRKRFLCDWCTESEGWESETEVHIHKSTAHVDMINKMLISDKVFFCLICVTEHTSREAYIQHIKTDHLLSSPSARRVERDIFVCNECNDIFFNKQMLAVHLAIMHKSLPKKSSIECPYCNKCLFLESYWTHFQHHRIQSVACCPICLHHFRDRKEMLQHTGTHPCQYNCIPCGFETKTLEAYQRHLNEHRKIEVNIKDEGDDKYVRKFFYPRSRSNKWSSHRVHSFRGLSITNNMFVCVLCRQICTTWKTMRAHVRNHSLSVKKELRQYTCTCREIFSSSILLKQHVFKLKGEHGVSETVVVMT